MWKGFCDGVYFSGLESSLQDMAVHGRGSDKDVCFASLSLFPTSAEDEKKGFFPGNMGASVYRALKSSIEEKVAQGMQRPAALFTDAKSIRKHVEAQCTYTAWANGARARVCLLDVSPC